MIIKFLKFQLISCRALIHLYVIILHVLSVSPQAGYSGPCSIPLGNSLICMIRLDVVVGHTHTTSTYPVIRYSWGEP